MRSFEKPPAGNNYDALAETYRATDVKPDKQYSILPTVVEIAGDLKDKTVLDLGCGNGFFAREAAKQGAHKVIGIDNAPAQIDLANKQPMANVEYRTGDIFTDELPKADVILSPFVANYPPTVEALKGYFRKLESALNEKGRVVLVVDLPTGHDLKRFGAVKTLQGPPEDGTPLQIDLYDGENHICTLHSTYFTQDTIQTSLEEAGFSKVAWHKPVVSAEGIQKHGQDFWEGYADNPELGFVTAEK